MKISRNTVATVGFVVTDEKGQVVGRTDPKEPVVALVGHGQLVKGLENAIDGHEKGDSFTVTLNPQDAYGIYDEALVQEVAREMFGDYPIEEGAVFEADTDKGSVPVVIKTITEDKVVVDGNHPLAGKVLSFLVTIEDVREATEEEKEHGHAHVDGHCCSSEGHSCGCGGGCSCHDSDPYEQMEQDSDCCHDDHACGCSSSAHEHKHSCGCHGHKE